jgi:hypothetical protein
MVVDIKNKYNEIENDVMTNQSEVFLRYGYYTHKYKSDILNDISLGLIINEDYKPVAQIFVRNKTGYIKTQLIFNKERNKVIDKQILNYKL